MHNRPNPQRIPNNFRLQTYIDEELAKAIEMLSEEKEKSSADLVAIGLTFLEIGDWSSVIKYSSEALKLEESKPHDSRDKEIIASVHYQLGTQKRELNDCKGALIEYEEAMSLAQSDWLKSNLRRNIGLVYLKTQDYLTAKKYFKEAYELINQNENSRVELGGSLPALYNYYALSITKAALKSNESPAEGIKLLEYTTDLYKAFFEEYEISDDYQRRSHDWQSHQFHRGMILCELAEKENKMDAQEKFSQAEKLLTGALAGRIANKADDQRLADVYLWLGRTAKGLNKTKNATQYFEKALQHYKSAFPKTPDANQIKDVRFRLEELVSASPLKQGSMFPPTVSSTGLLESTLESSPKAKI